MTAPGDSDHMVAGDAGETRPGPRPTPRHSIAANEDITALREPPSLAQIYAAALPSRRWGRKLPTIVNFWSVECPEFEHKIGKAIKA